MGQEGKFWFSVWSLLAAVVVVLVFIASFFGSSQDLKILQMVEAGDDPIEAKCALEGFSSNNKCMLHVLSRGEK